MLISIRWELTDTYLFQFVTLDIGDLRPIKDIGFAMIMQLFYNEQLILYERNIPENSYNSKT